jgi:golgi apparatus protein 1
MQVENQMSISWDCKEQLLRHEKETQDDIRLSVKLFQKCQRDAKKFCKDVPPGQMRVQQCLEDKLDDPELSGGCKEELDGVLAKQVSNFRLNTRLRTHCEKDLQQQCQVSLDDMDKDPEAKARGLACLQQYKEELTEKKCQKAVRRMMTRAGRDIRFDEALANACTEDRKKFCDSVQPVRAVVLSAPQCPPQ